MNDCRALGARQRFRAVAFSGHDVHRSWKELFTKYPWLDGLSSDSGCADVFCCPTMTRSMDWRAVSEAHALLSLAGRPTRVRVLSRDLLGS